MNSELKNVALGAVIKRINRKLAHQHERLCVTRGVSSDLGGFYAINAWRNVVIDTHIDPEHLARQLGVLRDGERVA
jgi:hypothetical protein